jgi:hypothetical protein
MFFHEATGGLRAGNPKVNSPRHRHIPIERSPQRWDKYEDMSDTQIRPASGPSDEVPPDRAESSSWMDQP